MKAIANFILLVIVLHIQLTSSALAQDLSGSDAQENVFKLGGIDVTSGVVRKFDNRYEGVKGSPFFNDSWLKGHIDLTDGRSSEDIKLKFNQYEDELIIQQSAGNAFYLPKEQINSFSFINENGQHLIFVKKGHYKKKGESRYYRVIIAGEISLLEYTRVVFEKANYEGGYSNDKKYDEFKKYAAYYYLQNEAATPVKVKQNASGVSKIFPGFENKIKSFIVDNNLDCRSPEDLAQVFSYHNSLQ